jgi:hypothetical protein
MVAKQKSHLPNIYLGLFIPLYYKILPLAITPRTRLGINRRLNIPTLYIKMAIIMPNSKINISFCNYVNFIKL